MANHRRGCVRCMFFTATCSSLTTCCSVDVVVPWCFYLNPHCRPRYECSYPTRGVIKENYN